VTVTTTRQVPRVSTLLLDLDGTFLDVDMPAFLEVYCSHAGRRFVSPRELPRTTRAMASAMQRMFASRAGTGTLDRVFFEGFSPAVGRSPLEVRKVFSAYHGAEFEQLRRLTAPREAARPLLEKALSLGYELVIATNPVFLLEAIRARIRWAGLEGIPLALVTAAEIMRCAKPHRRYFEQVLKLLGRRADECLMVGDDPVMDLPAGELGIGTWLAIPEPEEPLVVPGADCRGTLAELAAWLEERGPVGARRGTKRGQAAGSPGTREGKGTRETAASPAPDVFQAVQQLMREIEAASPGDEGMPRERGATLRGTMRAGRTLSAVSAGECQRGMLPRLSSPSRQMER
jgi:FMN phosphatase YigB (HAD superfamily)